MVWQFGNGFLAKNALRNIKHKNYGLISMVGVDQVMAFDLPSSIYNSWPLLITLTCFSLKISSKSTTCGKQLLPFLHCLPIYRKVDCNFFMGDHMFLIIPRPAFFPQLPTQSAVLILEPYFYFQRNYNDFQKQLPDPFADLAVRRLQPRMGRRNGQRDSRAPRTSRELIHLRWLEWWSSHLEG